MNAATNGDAPDPDPGPPIGEAARGSHPQRMNEPVAMILAGDCLRWLIPVVSRFPRHARFGLGNRIEGAMTDVIEALAEGRYLPKAGRRGCLDRANARLQVTRHLLRIAQEMGFLSARQAHHVLGRLFELGKQIGGWRKASDATANSGPESSTPAS